MTSKVAYQSDTRVPLVLGLLTLFGPFTEIRYSVSLRKFEKQSKSWDPLR